MKDGEKSIFWIPVPDYTLENTEERRARFHWYAQLRWLQ